MYQEVKRLLSRLQEGTWFPGRAPLSWKGLMAPSLVCTQNRNANETCHIALQ